MDRVKEMPLKIFIYSHKNKNNDSGITLNLNYTLEDSFACAKKIGDGLKEISFVGTIMPDDVIKFLNKNVPLEEDLDIEDKTQKKWLYYTQYMLENNKLNFNKTELNNLKRMIKKYGKA